jgi:hypothetical protein
MNKKLRKKLHDTVKNDGFDYSCKYRSFEEYKDKEFQQLLTSYLNARKVLREYIGIRSGKGY